MAKSTSAVVSVALLVASLAPAAAQSAPPLWPDAHYDRAQANYYTVKPVGCRNANVQTTILTLTAEIDWMDDYLGQVAGLLQTTRNVPASDAPAIARRGQLASWLPIWNGERATMWRWLLDLQRRPPCLDLAPPSPPPKPRDNVATGGDAGRAG